VKGIVFREFFNMVEEFHSDELLDRIIVKADLPSGGAYNTAGTYPHEELVRVLLVLSEETGTPVPELLDAFGRYLVPVFKSKFPRLFEKHRDPLDFLAEVDGFVHVEVRKAAHGLSLVPASGGSGERLDSGDAGSVWRWGLDHTLAGANGGRGGRSSIHGDIGSGLIGRGRDFRTGRHEAAKRGAGAQAASGHLSA
jgi:hypothetical protein